MSRASRRRPHADASAPRGVRRASYSRRTRRTCRRRESRRRAAPCRSQRRPSSAPRRPPGRIFRKNRPSRMPWSFEKTVGLVRIRKVGRSHDHVVDLLREDAQHRRRCGARSHIDLHLDGLIVDFGSFPARKSSSLRARSLCSARHDFSTAACFAAHSRSASRRSAKASRLSSKMANGFSASPPRFFTVAAKSAPAAVSGWPWVETLPSKLSPAGPFGALCP